MYKGLPISKTTYYRKQRKANALGISDIMDLPDLRGKHGNHAKGERHGRWNKYRLVSSHGYVLVRVPNNHPLAFGNGYAYEHEIVIYNATGIIPKNKNKVVHHKNGDKKDNRLSNLQLITQSKHMKEHQLNNKCNHKNLVLKRSKCKMLVCVDCGRFVCKCNKYLEEWPKEFQIQVYPKENNV